MHALLRTLHAVTYRQATRPALLRVVLLLAAGCLGALPAAAQVTAVPTAVEAALPAGETAAVSFTLHNASAAPVEVVLARRRAGSDGQGALWTYASSFFRLDPATGDVLATLPRPRPTGGLTEALAFDGEALYFAVGAEDNAVFRLDPATGDVLAAMRLPYGVEIDGLAHTGRALYGAGFGADGRLYELDVDEGRVVRTVDLAVSTIGGLTAGGSRGTLFVAGNDDGGIYEVDPSTGDVVNTLPVPGFLVGLGYSEELGLLFVSEVISQSQGRLYAVDPDTGEEVYEVPGDVAQLFVHAAIAADEAMGVGEWLGLGADTLMVPAGGSADVPLTLDATTLVAGAYAGEVVVTPRDGSDPLVVPVALTVTGTPAVTAEPTALAIGSVVAGATVEAALTVRNDGTAPLTVSAVTATDDAVSVEAEAFTLAPGRSRTLTASLTVPEVGPFAASVVVSTDDPSQPALSVPVTATGLPAPALVLTPQALSVEAEPGSTAAATLTLTNTGAGPLTFEAFGGWGGLLAPGRVTPAGYLPTVVADPVGDATSSLDLVAVRAAALRDTLFVELEFAEPVPVVPGYYVTFFLDTDQDASTGQPAPRFFLDPTIGTEYEFALWDEYSTVMNEPVHYDGARVRFGVPLATFGGDDGRMDLVVVVLDEGGTVTDVAPAEGVSAGYGSVGGPTWLSAEPASGSVPAGESVALTVTLDATALAEGVHEGALLLRTNDPAAAGSAGPDVVVPVTLTVGTPTPTEGGPSGTPSEFALEGAYPNPFGGRATVGYALPEAAEVRLVVYDVLGRQVAVLADGPFEAGRHEAELDGQGLPSGTYLVRMTTGGASGGGFAQTQRLTVVR